MNSTDRQPRSLSRTTIVTGTIGTDAHVTGTFVLSYALRQFGFKVVGLGVCVPQEDFIKAAIETRADAILISSLYGQGLLDCEGFREKCQEAGLSDIVLYIGGQLAIGKRDFGEVRQAYLKMGFDRVYPPYTPPEDAIRDLIADLAIQDAPALVS